MGALCLQGVQHQLVQGTKQAWQLMRPQVGGLCQLVLGMCQQGRPCKMDQQPQAAAICSVGGLQDSCWRITVSLMMGTTFIGQTMVLVPPQRALSFPQPHSD